MASIYQDYRGQNYTKIRKYWEPWYSSTYDDVDNESPYSHERRRILKQFLIKLLNKYGLVSFPVFLTI